MLSTIVPIILLLFLGIFCRKKKIFSADDMEALKKLSVTFLWPLILFYAFFTADYDFRTVFYAGTMFVLLTVVFFISKIVLAPRMAKHSFILPYLTAGSEIGMLGYSLYILLFGAENVYRLALFDVGHALFIFPIFLTSLNYAQGDGDLKKNLKDMLLSPIIIMLALGMICGISGLGSLVMNGPLRETVDRVYELASSANIVLMLTAMGYGISFTAAKLKECIGVILIRFAAMAASAVIGLAFLRFTVGLEKPTAYALLIALSMPPVFMLSVYVKDREENEFASTMTSIYTILSILLFLIMTAFAG